LVPGADQKAVVFILFVFLAVENNVEGVVSLFDKYNDCINIRKYLDPNGFNNSKS